MDGVLINSEIVYLELFVQFLHEQGVHKTVEDMLELVGSSREKEDILISSFLNLSIEETRKRKDAFFVQHPVDYSKIKKPGVDEILAYLSEHQIVIGLASSSPMDNILEVLDACKIRSYFTYILSGEDFTQTKPHPEIYETMIQKMKANREDIVVVEDSVYGIQAAKQAGLFVLALEDRVIRHDNRKADHVIQDLLEIKEYVEELSV